MTNHKRKTLVEVVTKFEQMRDVAKDPGHPDINGAYCGYGRQPIYTTKIEDKVYEISGTCALTGTKCIRIIDMEYEPAETCNTYKERFK